MKKLVRTYKYRLYPSRKQEAIFAEWLGLCRGVYNDFLRERKEHWEREKQLPKAYRISLGCFDQINQLPQLKKERKELKKVYANVLQATVRRLAKVFQRFYDGQKNGQKVGYPRFKSKRRFKSFTYPSYEVKVRGKTYFHFQIMGDKLQLGKIGLVKMVIDRPIPENAIIKTCTIKRDIDRWYACITFEVEVEASKHPLDPEQAVGIDVGLEKLATLNNGEFVANRRFLRASEKALAQAQRRLSLLVRRAQIIEKSND